MAAIEPPLYGKPVDRHRLYLQNLQRRKQQEKEAAAARNADRQGDLDKERGFQCFFNGANRQLGAPTKQPQTGQPQTGQQLEPPQRVNSKGLLRVAGALPVPLEAQRREWRPPPSQPPRTAGRRRGDANEPPQERRVRRNWELGRAVLLRAEDGEVLQIDLPSWGEARVQVLAVS